MQPNFDVAQVLANALPGNWTGNTVNIPGLPSAHIGTDPLPVPSWGMIAPRPRQNSLSNLEIGGAGGDGAYLHNGTDGYTPTFGAFGDGLFDVPADWRYGNGPSQPQAPEQSRTNDGYTPNWNGPGYQNTVQIPDWLKPENYNYTIPPEDLARMSITPSLSGMDFPSQSVQAPQINFGGLTQADLNAMMQLPAINSARQEGPGTAYNVAMNALGLLGPIGTGVGALGGFITGLTGDHLTSPDSSGSGIVNKVQDFVESPGLAARGSNWLGRQINGLFDSGTGTPGPGAANYQDINASYDPNAASANMQTLLQNIGLGGGDSGSSAPWSPWYAGLPDPYSMTGNMLDVHTGYDFGGGRFDPSSGFGQGGYGQDPFNPWGMVGTAPQGNQTT